MFTPSSHRPHYVVTANMHMSEQQVSYYIWNSSNTRFLRITIKYFLNALFSLNIFCRAIFWCCHTPTEWYTFKNMSKKDRIGISCLTIFHLLDHWQSFKYYNKAGYEWSRSPYIENLLINQFDDSLTCLFTINAVFISND